MVCDGSIVQNSNMTVRDPKAEFERLCEEHVVMRELYKTVLSDPPQSLFRSGVPRASSSASA
jgi:hypothetical protein